MKKNKKKMKFKNPFKRMVLLFKNKDYYNLSKKLLILSIVFSVFANIYISSFSSLYSHRINETIQQNNEIKAQIESLNIQKEEIVSFPNLLKYAENHGMKYLNQNGDVLALD